MIPWKPFVACPDSEVDEGLRVALNELGRWAEKRRISLFSGHNAGVNLHLRLKAALLLALDEASTPQVNDDKPDPRKKMCGPRTAGDPSRPIGQRRSTDLLSEELKNER